MCEKTKEKTEAITKKSNNNAFSLMYLTKIGQYFLYGQVKYEESSSLRAVRRNSKNIYNSFKIGNLHVISFRLLFGFFAVSKVLFPNSDSKTKQKTTNKQKTKKQNKQKTKKIICYKGRFHLSRKCVTFQFSLIFWTVENILRLTDSSRVCRKIMAEQEIPIPFRTAVEKS